MIGIQPLFTRSIDDIVALLPELDEHFRDEWFRALHNPLETIVLRRQPGSRTSDIQHQLAVVATRYTAYQPLSDAAEELCAHVQGRMGRVFLARLPAGAKVSGQIVAGAYERAVERFVLPITENACVSWSPPEGVTILGLLPGQWYAIDAHFPHAMRASADGPFVFLVCDVFPEQGEQPSGIDYDHLCPRAFG